MIPVSYETQYMNSFWYDVRRFEGFVCKCGLLWGLGLASLLVLVAGLGVGIATGYISPTVESSPSITHHFERNYWTSICPLGCR